MHLSFKRIIVLAFVAITVKGEREIGREYFVFREKGDRYTINSTSKYFRCSNYMQYTYFSWQNYTQPRCLRDRDIRHLPDNHILLHSKNGYSFGTIKFRDYNLFDYVSFSGDYYTGFDTLFHVNKTRFKCKRSRNANYTAKLSRITTYEYNRWVDFSLQNIETTTITEKLLDVKFALNVDFTGGLYRLYIQCGRETYWFFVKFKGYRGHAYPWYSLTEPKLNVTRKQSGDVFKSSVSKCGLYNAHEYHDAENDECQCNKKGTVMFDRFAQRCFDKQEINANFNEGSKLYLSRTNKSNSDVLWVVNKATDGSPALFDYRGNTISCNHITKKTCQFYGNGQMEICKAQAQFVILKQTVHIKLSKRSHDEYFGRLVKLSFDCETENNTNIYTILMKFRGNRKEIMTRKTKNINNEDEDHYTAIIISLTIILVILLISACLVYRYVNKLKRKRDRLYQEMKRGLNMTVTPDVYEEVLPPDHIYQQIPERSPFPRTGPLAIENFLRDTLS